MLSYFRSTALFAAVLAILQLLLPKGAGRTAASLACGAALAAVLISPLRGYTPADAQDFFRSFLPAAQQSVPRAELENEILSVQTAAYIEARAGELGYACRAEVALTAAEGGFRVDSVLLYAERQPPDALTAAIARELGCEKERISCSLS